ncbi:hypothetical protein B0T10DRAFT_585505 [Thelonectria olida]|uniref:Uncharacterized protein n=1 Tax=Thelonectria olida TaxID=1576542 RepID=A0A9P8VVI2_9HYPO|nr:hypothetical protein B0T10DRAFT_585505 [Thelonectria olida]
MAPSLTYSLGDVLAVAKIHPFYASKIQYPPDADTIHAARERAALSPPRETDLKSHRLLRKKDLYATIERLVDDTSPQNNYRHGIYTSITGGGSNTSKELFFATDALENRRHRAYFGQFLRTTGLIRESEERSKIKIDKIIYTSEGLTSAQKSHISTVLGSVKIYSLLGSAEAGPYAVSSPDLTPRDLLASHSGFVFDTRLTLIEILPLSSAEDGCNPDPVPEGETGAIAQTSLVRRRNPVVRYMTGDVGSLHPLPELAKSVIPEAHWPYLRVLRLQGRDRRFSFNWDGCYIEFEILSALMSTVSFGILQWQAILDKIEPSKEAFLELRLLCSKSNDEFLPRQAIINHIREFFHVCSTNEHRIRLMFIDDLTGFELSRTGRKVATFMNRFN